MTKEEYRISFKNKRKALSSTTFQQYCTQLTSISINYIKTTQPKTVHIFLPIIEQYEIITQPIIDHCWANNITTVLPVSDFNTQTIKSALYDATTELKKNKYNIPEPTTPVWLAGKSIDIVFTPLLAFDTLGNRLGYGGGFYDRFFASIPEVKKVGLSLFEPIENNLPTERFDFRLNHCITPKNIYSF